MAHTARNDEETKEYFDKADVLTSKINKLADMIKASKHFIVFTGAGISTAAGIADYRSGKDTVLKTGAGVWTKEAADKIGEKYKKGKTLKDWLRAIPTKSHMSLVKLEQEGLLKHLISMNCDGLHRRSGFPVGSFSELHGNTNLEYCEKCGQQYLRDFKIKRLQRYSKLTGRKCTKGRCKGRLLDSDIMFGESLPMKPLKDGFDNAEKADLCLVLGSSLTVTPAADMPRRVGVRGKNLVIVNLQATPLNGYAAMIINAKIDDVMVGLMTKLGLDIPQFRLKRFITFDIVGTQTQGYCLQVKAVDSDGTPFELFNKGTLITPKQTIDQTEPLQFPVKEVNLLRKSKIKLDFFGHYAEPSLELQLGKILEPLLSEMSSIGIKKDTKLISLAFEYDPMTRVWTSGGKSLESLMGKNVQALAEDEKKKE